MSECHNITAAIIVICVSLEHHFFFQCADDYSHEEKGYCHSKKIDTMFNIAITVGLLLF